MNFDSVGFFFFLLIVYLSYIILGTSTRFGLNRQNFLLLIASYFFYACWDWRVLILLLLTTINDYVVALKIEAASNPMHRKRWLLLSIGINLSVLFVFKHFSFFFDSFSAMLSMFGVHTTHTTLKILLPAGISFYTFQSLSYSIDVYRAEIQACRSFRTFALFISFFPQLVAGPITRAKYLLPQFEKARSITWEHINTGTYLICWGIFQKVFVADNLAPIVQRIYASNAPYNGAEVLTAGIAFSFQLICDFAGYSNIARGTAKIMGFELPENFRTPYFSSNVVEFWQRWHITLGSWFKDYVYSALYAHIPGKKRLRQAAAVLATFGLVGLWHGGAWTFVVWGLFVGVQLVCYIALRPFLEKSRPTRGTAKSAWHISSVLLVNALWITGSCLFLGTSFQQSMHMYASLFTAFTLNETVVSGLVQIAMYSAFFMIIETLHYVKDDALAVLKLPIPARSLVYVVIFYSIAYFGRLDGAQFIYFQF